MTHRAFTLLELLIALIVLGLLVTLAVTRYMKMSECRLQQEARDTLDELFKADQIYRMKHGAFTSDINALPLITPAQERRSVLTYSLDGSGDSNFLGTARHPRGHNTHVQFNETRGRCLYETGWPCPLIQEPGCGG